MDTIKSAEFEFIASATNYIHIFCRRCGSEAGVEYLGLDPVLPQIRTTCPKCGALATFKIFNAGPIRGFHSTPAGQIWNVCCV